MAVERCLTQMLGTELRTSVGAVGAPNSYIRAFSSLGTEENLLPFALAGESHLQLVCKQRKKKSLCNYVSLRPNVPGPTPLRLARNTEYHFPDTEHVCDYSSLPAGATRCSCCPAVYKGSALLQAELMWSVQPPSLLSFIYPLLLS